MKKVLLIKIWLIIFVALLSFITSIPAISQVSQTFIRTSWSCGGGSFNSLVSFDTLIYASTPDNHYYLIDNNYNMTMDSLPDVGTYTPSIKKFYIGRDNALYALTDTVVMKLTSSGWLNTGFVTGTGIRDIAVDQNGVIWTITNLPLVPGTSELKRFDGLLTHTIPSFYYPYWVDHNFKADDSGAVWLGTHDGLLRYDTSSFTQFFPNQNAYEIHIDSIGNLFFLLDTILMKRDSNGFSTLHNLPVFPVWDMATTIYNGNYYLFHKNWSTGGAALYEFTLAAINQVGLGGMTFCSDSTYSCLTFDHTAKFWIMGKNLTESGGNIYVQDTTLAASVSGKVFHDVNQNGIYDGGDLPMPGVEIFNQFTNLTVTSDINGDYTIPLPGVIGATWYSYQIPIYLPSPWSFTTPDYQTYSTLDGLNVTGIDHGLYAPATTNLRVYGFGALLPPGFDSYANFYVQNVSTTTLYNIDTWFVNSSVFDTCISQVPPTTVNQNIYYWLIDSLTPLGTKMFPLVLPMDSTTALGLPVNFAFYINHPLDLYSGDDSIIVQSVVSGSFDPNDKQVVPDRPEKTIAPEELLTYTIRFQNTGTAPATRVVLRDTLSQNLDLSTLKFIGSSHPYTYAFYPGNEMVITYENINLPDSGANFAESMGAITFTVQPLPGLPNGAQITNDAYIYFDFNQPIQTNQTLSIISIISVDQPKPESPYSKLHVWPNPARGSVTLTHSGLIADQQYRIEIYDPQGKLIASKYYSVSNKNIEIDISGLTNGIYVGVILIDGIPVAFRLVKSGY